MPHLDKFREGESKLTKEIRQLLPKIQDQIIEEAEKVPEFFADTKGMIRAVARIPVHEAAAAILDSSKTAERFKLSLESRLRFLLKDHIIANVKKGENQAEND